MAARGATPALAGATLHDDARALLRSGPDAAHDRTREEPVAQHLAEHLRPARGLRVDADEREPRVVQPCGGADLRAADLARAARAANVRLDHAGRAAPLTDPHGAERPGAQAAQLR